LHQNPSTGSGDIIDWISKNVWNRILSRYEILSISHVFWSSIDDISGFSRWILKKDSFLETLLVVDYTTKMTAQNLWNLIAKFGSKVEICWKLEELKWNFLNNSEVSNYLLGHILLFWKYDADYRINTKLPMNYSFRKNICAGLINSGSAAGEWLITDEFSTDLDEMGIFVLSKDQTFRICATFLDPAKFSI
jgi:hypothetical protein